MTTWLPVVGFEDSYEVSENGEVRRTSPASGTYVGRVLKPRLDHKGYLYVRLGGRMTRVHRIVAAAHFGASEMLVRHLDGNPLNNHFSNLRYGTPLENAADRISHGRHRLNGRLERTHCRRGHEYTPENTKIKRREGQRPYRECRECHRVMRFQARLRKREQNQQG